MRRVRHEATVIVVGLRRDLVGGRDYWDNQNQMLNTESHDGGG